MHRWDTKTDRLARTILFTIHTITPLDSAALDRVASHPQVSGPYLTSKLPTTGLMTVLPSLSFPLRISSKASFACSSGYRWLIILLTSPNRPEASREIASG